MDCNMPFLDGYEATRQIRKLCLANGISRENQPLIIAITGHVEDEYVQKALTSGMDRVFQKPLSVHELAAVLLEKRYIDSVPENLKDDEE